MNERPLGSVFRELSIELGTLVRQESELARAELRTKAAQVGQSAKELGAGAVVAFAGFIVLLQSAVYALSPLFDSPALAALAVGGINVLVGLALLARGRSQLNHEELGPKRTLRSLRKDLVLARLIGRRA